MNSSRQLNREKQVFRYMAALERGDFDTVTAILKQAESDPMLEQMILEVNDALEEEAPSTVLPKATYVQHDGGQSMGVQSIPYPQAYKNSDTRRRQSWAISPTFAALLFISAVSISLLMLTINAPEPERFSGLSSFQEQTGPTPTPAPTQSVLQAPPFRVVVIESPGGGAITEVAAQEAITTAQADFAVFTQESLIVYDGINAGANELARLEDGAVFTIVAYTSNSRVNDAGMPLSSETWATVYLEDGTPGFINASVNDIPVLGPIRLNDPQQIQVTSTVMVLPTLPPPGVMPEMSPVPSQIMIQPSPIPLDMLQPTLVPMEVIPQPSPIPGDPGLINPPFSVVLVDAESGEGYIARMERLLNARDANGVDAAVVIFEPLVIYSTSDAGAEVIGSLNSGDRFTVMRFIDEARVSSTGQWYGVQRMANINLANGLSGYVDVTFNNLSTYVPDQITASEDSMAPPFLIPTATPAMAATVLPTVTPLSTFTPVPTVTAPPEVPTLVATAVESGSEGD